MKTWFTADTHFGHQRTLDLSKRPFRSVEHMNYEIISNWNRVVGKHDTVFHLGDFGDSLHLKSLTGARIIFLPGNYDGGDSRAYLSKDSRVEIIDIGYVAKHDAKSFWLVHEPQHMTHFEKFYLFGHVHKLRMIMKNGLNVGVDCHHFTPIDWDTVNFYRNAIENHYDHNVFM